LDLNDEIFMANPLVVIAGTRSILAKQAGIELKSLAEQRFILREQGSGTRMGVDQYFKKNKFRPNIRMELGSNEAIKEAVAGGLGIGIVSRHSLHGQQKEHGVAVVDVLGFPILSNWHIVHPASKKLSPIATEFKLHMRKELRHHV
jgi:DNA-binding transcriptional LysR family regulator